MEPDNGVALITGAASGLGAVFADRLAKQGFDLILVSHDHDPCQRLARRLSTVTGRRIDIIVADLACAGDLRRVEHAIGDHARLNLLVNAPDLAIPGHVAGGHLEAFEHRATHEALAMSRLAYAAAPGLAARGGAMVNIATPRAWAPGLLDDIAACAGAYVLAFSQALHARLGPLGVCVQAVLPGTNGDTIWDHEGHRATAFPNGQAINPGAVVDDALARVDRQRVRAARQRPPRRPTEAGGGCARNAAWAWASGAAQVDMGFDAA